MDAPSGSEEGPLIYQFKVVLQHRKPPIWRRILVPADFTFAQLHIALQCAMGWASACQAYHLHQFTFGDPKKRSIVAIITPRCLFQPALDDCFDEETVKLDEYFFEPKDKCSYEYDLGELYGIASLIGLYFLFTHFIRWWIYFSGFGWTHTVLLEKILPVIPGKIYPICLAGRMACPPEDGYPEEGEESEDYEPKIFDYKLTNKVNFKPPEGWEENNAQEKHKLAYF